MKEHIIRNSFLSILFILIANFVLIDISISMILKEPSKRSIIKKFDENEELFKSVVKELENIDEIYIDKSDGDFTITIFYETEDSIIKEKVPEEDYVNYKKTMLLINKVKVTDVYKYSNNIIFNMTNHQDIIMTKDKNSLSDYGSSDELYKIKNNWYYGKRHG